MRQSSRRILNLIFELLLRRESSKKVCCLLFAVPHYSIEWRLRILFVSLCDAQITQNHGKLPLSLVCVCVCAVEIVNFGLTFITFGWRVCQHHSRCYGAIHLLCKVKPNAVMSIVLELASFACSRTQLTCSRYVLLSYNFHFLVRR